MILISTKIGVQVTMYIRPDGLQPLPHPDWTSSLADPYLERCIYEVVAGAAEERHDEWRRAQPGQPHVEYLHIGDTRSLEELAQDELIDANERRKAMIHGHVKSSDWFTRLSEMCEVQRCPSPCPLGTTVIVHGG